MQPATLTDLQALPDSTKGELIDGVLYAMTHPRGPHQRVTGHLHADFEPDSDRGHGGFGGWQFLPEPGLSLPGAQEIAAK